MPIDTAELDWKDGLTPVSRRFHDVYFSAEDGLEESRYVFLRGNGLPDAWRRKDRFCICETGFGSGLNFLATWDLWRRHRPKGAELHYLSLEAYPMTRGDMAQALAPWAELIDLTSMLLPLYPDPQPGFHRIALPDGITLTLMVGDVIAMLRECEAKIDAWYLDGFSPAQNPDMWQEAMFAEMARLSADGATAATFTSAGHVRSNLEANGFEVTRVPGFGRKRHMTEARFHGAEAPLQKAPWYTTPSPHEGDHKVVVLGAGIAGASTAFAFARRGWDVQVIDRHDGIAQEASGNPEGMLMPRFAVDQTPEGRFYGEAFRATLQGLQSLIADGAEIPHDLCGVLQFARDEKEHRRLQALAKDQTLPESMMRWVTAREAKELAGVSVSHAALYYPNGGWIAPRAFCEALLRDVPVHTGIAIEQIEYDNAEWRLKDARGVVMAQAPVFVLANGIDALRFGQVSWLPLQAFRGQMSLVPETETSRSLKSVLSFGSYMIPSRDGRHAIGATYDKVSSRNGQPAVKRSDHKKNVDGINAFLPDLIGGDLTPEVRGRAALRCTTPDRHPVAGPVPDADYYRTAYERFRHGPLGAFPEPQYLPGLYAHVALGSRGLTTALISAELIASQVCGAPLPLEKSIVDTLHPARFLMRQIKRSR